MQILHCQSVEHAQLVDGLVFSSLHSEYGTKGNGWSGVYTNGNDYGICWDPSAMGVLGDPEADTSLEIIDVQYDDSGNPDWIPIPPPEPIQDEV